MTWVNIAAQNYDEVDSLDVFTKLDSFKNQPFVLVVNTRLYRKLTKRLGKRDHRKVGLGYKKKRIFTFFYFAVHSPAVAAISRTQTNSSAMTW